MFPAVGIRSPSSRVARDSRVTNYTVIVPINYSSSTIFFLTFRLGPTSSIARQYISRFVDAIFVETKRFSLSDFVISVFSKRCKSDPMQINMNFCSTCFDTLKSFAVCKLLLYSTEFTRCPKKYCGVSELISFFDTFLNEIILPIFFHLFLLSLDFPAFLYFLIFVLSPSYYTLRHNSC